MSSEIDWTKCPLVGFGGKSPETDPANHPNCANCPLNQPFHQGECPKTISWKERDRFPEGCMDY